MVVDEHLFSLIARRMYGILLTGLKCHSDFINAFQDDGQRVGQAWVGPLERR